MTVIYPTGNHVKHEIILPPQKKTKKKTIQINSYVYENVSWDANINKKLRRYANCKHCIAVHLILKHNQKGSRLRRWDALFIKLSWNRLGNVTWRGVMTSLTTTKFQTFIFLIGYIYVNKGVFCFINYVIYYISYLRIKSYNVLNYYNCSTDEFSFKCISMKSE